MKNRDRKTNTDFKIIKKSNQLIEARYKFDVWESRMFLTVLSFNLVGDTLRALTDPRQGAL